MGLVSDNAREVARWRAIDQDRRATATREARWALVSDVQLAHAVQDRAAQVRAELESAVATAAGWGAQRRARARLNRFDQELVTADTRESRLLIAEARLDMSPDNLV